VETGTNEKEEWAKKTLYSQKIYKFWY